MPYVCSRKYKEFWARDSPQFLGAFGEFRADVGQGFGGPTALGSHSASFVGGIPCLHLAFFVTKLFQSFMMKIRVLCCVRAGRQASNAHVYSNIYRCNDYGKWAMVCSWMRFTISFMSHNHCIECRNEIFEEKNENTVGNLHPK